MAKFAVVALLALVAFQAALARPCLADKSPAAQSVDILRDVQDVVTALAAKKNDQSVAAAKAAAQSISDRVEDIAYTLALEAWTGYGGDIGEQAALDVIESREAVQQLTEKLTSIASAANAAIELSLQAAEANLEKLGKEAEPAKALLPTIKDAYSQFFTKASSLLNDAAQKEVAIATKAINYFGGGDVYNPDQVTSDAEDQVQKESASAVAASGVELQRAAAAVDKAISALSQA